MSPSNYHQQHRRRNKLIIIGHAQIDPEYPVTSHRGTNEIIKAYKRHFDEIIYIGTADNNLAPRPTDIDGVMVAALEFRRGMRGYLKSLFYYFQQRHFTLGIIRKFRPTIIQLRIPSFFVFVRYLDLVKTKIALTTYIAGDFYDSHTKNKDYLFAKPVAWSFDKFQNWIVKGTIPVVAGPVLMEKYAKIRSCHAYMSTTHNKVTPRKNALFNKTMLVIGNLVPLKRVEDAIRALFELNRTDAGISLVIIGNGPYAEELKQLVTLLNLDEFVDFEGSVADTSRMQELFEQADILLHPSLSEGTPKVLAEAMAHGVVPIAVRGVGSISYIIEDGVNGYLVEPKSPMGIANIVKKIYNDNTKYLNMVEKAYEYARRHTLDAEVLKMWDFVKIEMKKTDE